MGKGKKAWLPTDWKLLNIPAPYMILIIVGAIGGYGWLVSSFAPRSALAQIEERIIVAQTQVQSALDRQIEDLTEKLNNARAKPKKTNADVAYIQYLERQVENAKRMREGKIK